MIKERESETAGHWNDDEIEQPLMAQDDTSQQRGS